MLRNPDSVAIPALPSGPPLEGYVRPLGFTVADGDPRCRNWRHYLRDEGGERVQSGLWECTPGAFRFRFEHWEFLHLIAGRVVIEVEGGETITLAPGDGLVIEPGLSGRWEVRETVLKHYVTRLRLAPPAPPS